MRIITIGTENQYGTVVPYEAVLFFEDKWYLEKLNCQGAASLGLGTCWCNSHPTFLSKEISREKARELLNGVIPRERKSRFGSLMRLLGRGSFLFLSKEESAGKKESEIARLRKEIAVLDSLGASAPHEKVPDLL